MDVATAAVFAIVIVTVVVIFVIVVIVVVVVVVVVDGDVVVLAFLVVVIYVAIQVLEARKREVRHGIRVTSAHQHPFQNTANCSFHRGGTEGRAGGGALERQAVSCCVQTLHTSFFCTYPILQFLY